MSQKHLAKGSQQPPTVDGKLRLYSMEYCPYAQRARLVLNVKNIPHDKVNINLQNKPEWYLKINPKGSVPAIDTGSEIVVESLVIADFLDEKYPNPPLYPKDERAKKADKALVTKVDELSSKFFKFLLFSKELNTPDEWFKEFSPDLQVFENELAKRKTTYFGGDKPGMVDYMAFPLGERTEYFLIFFAEQLPLKTDYSNQFPLLLNWLKSMKEDKAAKATYHPPEKHFNYFQLRLKNETIIYDD